jgi:hypothetical protein
VIAALPPQLSLPPQPPTANDTQKMRLESSLCIDLPKAACQKGNEKDEGKAEYHGVCLRLQPPTQPTNNNSNPHTTRQAKGQATEDAMAKRKKSEPSRCYHCSWQLAGGQSRMAQGVGTPTVDKGGGWTHHLCAGTSGRGRCRRSLPLLDLPTPSSPARMATVGCVDVCCGRTTCDCIHVHLCVYVCFSLHP